jgi:hypothetical protein
MEPITIVVSWHSFLFTLKVPKIKNIGNGYISIILIKIQQVEDLSDLIQMSAFL